MNEERKRIKAVVLDPQAHPEVAYDQLRLLVLQLKLLADASGGADVLARSIEPQHEHAELVRAVLATLQAHQDRDRT